ncbi:DNA-directed DNA polymerase POL5 [Aspergillus homomorphus CBS 101889]|uniref:DNA polymerase V n=1 Tax=Aspergillus homomorphus (strain CBS 101889) TaxID=1450537 RepID=A0A395IC38_ASPHC|nr:hypothetical protein BO97DRAFT_402161 [Aspergillus homomorphus CBS 101889]RAL17601.1 hypothetical protein BO97DRAFT_402161 [Aspergillus homomorphus CBS 101889]
MAPPNAASATTAPTKKRRREAFNVDIKQVEIYEDLANEKDEIRLKAAQALVSQFTPDKSPTEEQVRKALQRLFRGLCSSRKAARVGFSIALTEILAQVFAAASPKEEGGLSVAAVLDVWENLSNPAGGESGQEQRDHYFGRLFGAEAIIKSGILFRTTQSDAGQWTRLLDLVFELAKKKPWLREECGWVVYRCVFELASSSSKKNDKKQEAVDAVSFVETALERLCAHDLAKTPEGISVWLAARDLFPSAKVPAKVWKHDDPLDARERNSLAKVMKDSSDSSSGSGAAVEATGANAKSSGVWSSKLHFAWDVVLGRLAEAETAAKKSRLGFAEFWTEVVDNGLFAAASSEERKYWGFSLFVKVVSESPLPVASQVFTKNLVRCLMNQLAVEDRYLHRMAVKAAKAIQTRVSKEPAFAAAAVRGLMGPSGSVTFDQATKTKTVEKIVVEANPEALQEIVPLLEALVASPGTKDSKAAAANRQFLTNLLLAIVRARASASTEEDQEAAQGILEQILSIFVRFAYFKSDAATPAFTEQTQELFRGRINSSINSLIVSSKFATVPYAVVRKIRDLAKSEEAGKFIINMDETINGAVKNAFKSLKKLASMEKKDNTASANAFRLLYSLTILQVYNGDADAASMLEELDFCYTRIFGDKKKDKKKKSKKDDSDDEEEETDASDALVEILLSFASKQSQLFRRMSEQVFGAFAESITENGLDSLTSVLEAKESLAGQQEMFDQQDEEGDADMMDVDDDDEEDSDVEVVEANGSDDESDDDNESPSDDDEDAGNDDEEAIFEAKLAAALGTHRADADMDEAEADSDADMNDDEMEELDEQLVKVFRARRDALGQKQDKKDARENMVNFKNRVLDLLEIYVKKCHSKPLALDLLLPLLRLTRKTSVKQISGKAAKVLREYTKQCKGATGLPAIEDPEPVWELLKSIHTEATHSGPPMHTTSCSQASLLVVKVLVAHDKANVARAVDVYGETRKAQLLSRKCHVQPLFFTDWSNWCLSFSKQKN